MELPNSMIIKAKIEAAHQLIHNENHAKSQIVENLESRKLDRESLFRQLVYLVPMNFQNRRKRMKRRVEYAQQNLYQLHISTKDEGHLKESELESINTLISKIRHGTKSMVEEKRIYRAMKHAAEPHSNEQTNNVHTIIPTFDEIQEMRKHKKAFNATMDFLKGKLEASNKDILSLQKQLDAIHRNKQEIYEYILQLRKHPAYDDH